MVRKINWFYSEERWKLLSARVFERMQIYSKEKKVIRYITTDLKLFSGDSDEPDAK